MKQNETGAATAATTTTTGSSDNDDVAVCSKVADSSLLSEDAEPPAAVGDDTIVASLKPIKWEVESVNDFNSFVRENTLKPHVVYQALKLLSVSVEGGSKTQMSNAPGDAVLDFILELMQSLGGSPTDGSICSYACVVLKAFGKKGDELRINAATKGAIKSVLDCLGTFGGSLGVQVNGLGALKELVGAQDRAGTLDEICVRRKFALRIFSFFFFFFEILIIRGRKVPFCCATSFGQSVPSR